MEQPLGVFDYTNEQYHASEGLSRSKLWTFKNLPFQFWYQYLSGEYQRPKESEAFLVGNTVHTMVLEPQLFDRSYFIMPKVNRATKQGKVDYAIALDESEGKTLLNQEQYDLCLDMRESVLGNATALDILAGAKMEKSLYWKHENTGLTCKSRPDIWNNSIVGDLKTCLDASPRAFQASAYKEGYYLQAGMAFEACKAIGQPFDKFVFICVEKKAPFSTALYVLDDDALQFGIDMFHSLMERIAQCFEKNVWPDYGIQKLTIPKYATMEVQGEQD